MAEDRFLSRWSRMKARSRGGRAADAPAQPRPDPAATAWRPHDGADVAEKEPASDGVDETASGSGAPGSGASAVVDEAQVLAEWPEDLPHPNDLDSDSDYSPFFSSEVSEAVRNIALRRLWRSNPLFANVDGLVDYGEDFTDAATVIAGMKSAYQVGKGYAREAEEKLAEAEGALDRVEAEGDGPRDSDPAAEPAAESAAESGAEAAPDARPEDAEPDGDEGRGEGGARA